MNFLAGASIKRLKAEKYISREITLLSYVCKAYVTPILASKEASSDYMAYNSGS